MSIEITINGRRASGFRAKAAAAGALFIAFSITGAVLLPLVPPAGLVLLFCALTMPVAVMFAKQTKGASDDNE